MEEREIEHPSLTTELRNTLSPKAVVEAFVTPPPSDPRECLLGLAREVPFMAIGAGIGIAVNEGVMKVLEQSQAVPIHINSGEALLIWTAYSFLLTGVVVGSAVTMRHFTRRFLPSIFPTPQSQ